MRFTGRELLPWCELLLGRGCFGRQKTGRMVDIAMIARGSIETHSSNLVATPIEDVAGFKRNTSKETFFENCWDGFSSFHAAMMYVGRDFFSDHRRDRYQWLGHVHNAYECSIHMVSGMPDHDRNHFPGTNGTSFPFTKICFKSMIGLLSIFLGGRMWSKSILKDRYSQYETHEQKPANLFFAKRIIQKSNHTLQKIKNGTSWNPHFFGLYTRED